MGSFSNLFELNHLDLSNNYITGTIPGLFFKTLCEMQEKLLSRSPHKASIVTFEYPFNLLRHFNLQHNKLVGTIPPEIGLDCFWIEDLLLGDNKLTGVVPSELFVEMPQVFSFD